MTAYRITIDDLNLYYSGTHMLYKEVPHYIRAIRPERSRVDAEGRQTNSGGVTIELSRINEVYYGPPEWITIPTPEDFFNQFKSLPRTSGYVNILNFSVFITRFPRREARKDFCIDTASLTYAPERARYVYEHYSSGVRALIINELAKPNYRWPTFQQCLDLVGNGGGFASMAWHPDWCVSWQAAEAVPLVMYKTHAVGAYLNRHKEDIQFHPDSAPLLDAFLESQRHE